MTDVIIIGGGIVGCAAARELMRFKLSAAVLEKGNDVAVGTSKANSGIVHSGYDALTGTLKAKFNVAGNFAFDKLSKQLDFPFGRCGALVLCFDAERKSQLETLKERGVKNGVKGLEIVEGERLKNLAPNSAGAVCALYAPTSGITDPYNATIAFAENAADNGARFEFGACVTDITPIQNGYCVRCADGRVFNCRAVINAAGVYADDINNMVCECKLSITPRKGEYVLLDKRAGFLSDCTLFNLPTDLGKGVLVSPTTHGNILVGPTAEDIADKEDTSTTAEGLQKVLTQGSETVKGLNPRDVITQFCGLRAHEKGDDFVIGEGAPCFFNAAGIESPGLTAAPAIAEFLAESVAKRLNAEENKNFKPERKGIPHFAALPQKEQIKLINEDPAYARVVCRCETVTEGEILQAIRRTPGARDLDGIKRRTRAGMGRCQSGFCMPAVMEILARELECVITAVTKSGGGSVIVYDGLASEEK